MRKVLISAAAAASALVFVAPASAQWAPPPAQGPYGNAYGYNNYGQTRSLQARVDRIQRQIVRLDQRHILSNREARRLREESREVERRLHNASRNGISPREFAALDSRIQRLENRVQLEARDGNGWRNGYNAQSGWVDRDRDGRDDRYEGDRRYRHD